MLLIKLILTLALPLLLGYCIVGLIIKNKPTISFLERFSLAWGIGIGLLGLEMFTLSLAGIPLNLPVVSIPIIVFVFIMMLYLYAKKIPLIDLSSLNTLLKEFKRINRGDHRWRKAAEILLTILIVLTIFFVFFDASIKPIVNFDDLWRQGSIAKIIFVSGKVITEQTAELAGPHPFLNPLSQAWVYMGMGSWNDALGKIIFALCYTSLLLIFYANLRKQSSRLFSLLFAYLFTSFPLIIYHAGTAYSDLMQTFYYSAGIIYLFQWMRQGEHADLYFSALLLGIGNFVKQSGIPLWIIATLVLFTYIFIEKKNEIRRGGVFLLISFLISAPWLFYQNSFLMKQITNLGGKIAVVLGKSAITGSDIVTGANPSLVTPTLFDIFYHLGRRMFTYADWQILWFVLILALIFGWKSILETRLKYLLLIIVLNLAMIVYAFFDPATYQYLLDGTLVERLMMYQIPVVLFLLASILQTFNTPEPQK